MATRVIDQNLPHELRGHSEEMSTILPLWQSLFGHAHVGFVHQGRALQRVVGTLALQIAVGNAAQFGVHQRQQRVERRLVSASPADQ